MNNVTDPGAFELKVVRRFRIVSTVAGPVAMAVGLLVIGGWIFHIHTLTSIFPGFNNMKPNVALGLVLGGFALWWLCDSVNCSKSDVAWKVIVARLCAGCVALIGSLTLVEHLFHFDLGIDQALLRDTFDDPRKGVLGQMSIATSFALFILGLSLFCLGSKNVRGILTAQVLALAILIDAVIGFLGYLYGLQSLYAVPVYATMAIHTALVLVLLCLGILFARPEQGLTAVIASKHSGGLMARYILPFAITLPFFLGWLRLAGQHAGYYGTEFGLALFATSNIITFSVLVWMSARSLNLRSVELAQKDYRYRFLADKVPAMVWTAKPDGSVDYFNERWLNYTGQTFDEATDWGWKPVVHPDDIQTCLDHWSKSIATGCDYEVEYRFKRGSDGAYLWFLGRAFALYNERGEIIQWVGTCTDIDAQKRAHNELESRVAERTVELAAAKEGLQAVLDAATQVAIIAVDADAHITVFNSGAEKLLGYTAAEVLGQTPRIFHLATEVHARGVELSKKLGREIHGLDAILENPRNGRPDEAEWTFVRKDGSHFAASLIVTASRDAGGAITGFLGIATDISERRKAQEVLRASEERFRLTVDAIEDYAIFMLDPMGCVASWNAGAERINGYTAAEIMGKHFSCFYLAPDKERGHPGNELRIAAEKGRYREEGWRVRRDGTRFLADVVVTAVRDDSGKLHGFAQVTRDITKQKSVEKKLEDQALILDLANDTIFIRDSGDRVTYWNHGAERLYGWSKEEAIGHVTHDLLKTKFPEPLAEINAHMENSGYWEGELLHTRRDGSNVIVASSWTAQRNEANEIASVIEMNFDITGRKLAEEESARAKERLDTILNSSLDGVIVYEAMRDAAGVLQDFRFGMINPATERLMGMAASEIVGHTLLEKFPNVANDGLFEKFGRVVDHNETLDIEHPSSRTFPPRWYRIAGVKLADGLVLSYADISARKQYEHELHAAKVRAESADNAKSDFLANMSHEIRTPMNGVIGMTGLLLDTRLDPEQRGLAETIQTSADSLLGLINDILDFSKIEAGKLAIEEMDFNLRKVIEDTLEILAPQAHAKGIELVGGVETDVLTTLRGDPGRVRQILTNLIGNAIKFTSTGEVAARVTTESETESEVLLRFEIKDTGIGISREAKARLFQPFIQADTSTARMFGGTGLGLAICKRLAESMQGDIGVESYPGTGSRFWVTLRFRRQLNPDIQAPANPDYMDTRVLIVDDNKMSRHFLGNQVSAWQMRSRTADSADRALAILRQAVVEKAPFRVAIVDLNMPAVDGIGLVRQINADPQLSATQIIMLTPFGRSIADDELKIVRIAANCVKPVRQSALFDCFAQVLGNPAVQASASLSETVFLPNVLVARRKERILLAEDNAVNQQVALGNLGKLGYSADVVTNGIEVLEALERGKYDIILMDCQMPDLDGYQTTKEIRQREQNGRHTRIIAMTANVMIGDREKCLAAGMDDYVSKPLRRSELRAALDRISSAAKPALDEAAVKKMQDDNEDDLAELIELFVGTAPASITGMQTALAKTDVKALCMAAHTLKGSCSNWGASPLREICAQIENNARDGKLEGMVDKVASAESELYRFIQGLEPFRKTKLST